VASRFSAFAQRSRHRSIAVSGALRHAERLAEVPRDQFIKLRRGCENVIPRTNRTFVDFWERLPIDDGATNALMILFFSDGSLDITGLAE
jgi:hypothetical protein